MAGFESLLARSLGAAHAPGTLTILQFHRVLQAADPLQPGEIDLHAFEQLLDFIQGYGTVVNLQEGLAAVRAGRAPRRALALSFDDGYTDWVYGVAPALLARGIPATFFVTTGQLDGRVIWHERIVEAVRALPDQGLNLPYGLAAFEDLSSTAVRAQLVLALQDLLKYASLPERELGIRKLEAQAVRAPFRPEGFGAEHVAWLHAKGFDIGAHTHHHPILNSVSDDDARREIAECREVLEGITRASVTHFAYPNGRPHRDFAHRHREMVAAAGYRGAVATGGGVYNRGADDFLIPRFAPWSTRPWRLAAQLVRNSRQPETPALSAAAPSTPPSRVMIVENGAGFGGAIVALDTLLKHCDPRLREYHVVTNLPVGRFADLPAVRSCRVLSDHVFDARALAQAFKSWPLPGPIKRLLLFGLGRADDLFNRLPYLLRLLRTALRLRPDIIHGNNELASNREALLVARALRIPYVQHVRGPLGFSRHQGWMLRQPQAFIAVSRWLSRSLVASGAAPERVRHIYDGVPLPTTSRASSDSGGLRSELGVPAARPLVAMVGMLIPWKGQPLFLEAVARAHAQHPDLVAGVTWLLVGGVPERADPDYQAQLQATVQRMRPQVDVRLLGHRSDLQSMLDQIDVVVSASLDPEPLGLVMLEALRFGCVFVGPDHGAAPEVVREGEGGHLFAPCDCTALSWALVRALATAQSVSREDRQAHAIECLKPFDPQVCAVATRRVHDRLVHHMRLHP